LLCFVFVFSFICFGLIYFVFGFFL
jgi:hypothetical protein